MLLGSSFPFIEQFALMRVFPGLQDKLSTFPVATIYNRIIKDWPQLRPQFALFKTPDLYRKLEQLYGAYALALSKGANRYQTSDRNPPFMTVSFIMQQTGIDRGTVVAFLSTLEKLAKEGGISMEYWDPKRAIQQAKAVTAQKKAIEAVKPATPIVEAVSTVKTTAKWLGVIAVLGLGAYALSSVGAFIPKKRGR